MSLTEIVAAMQRRIMGEKKKKSLPWYCIILMDKCVEPDKDCIDCRVYKEHEEELIQTGKIVGKMRRDE